MDKLEVLLIDFDENFVFYVEESNLKLKTRCLSCI
jgi:hypothetical protein